MRLTTTTGLALPSSVFYLQSHCEKRLYIPNELVKPLIIFKFEHEKNSSDISIITETGGVS